MRKSGLTIIALMLVLSYSNIALSFDPMGPPKAGLNEGQFSWRGEYLYGKMDVEAGGALGLSGSLVEDIEMNRIYANFGYGINRYWEVFVRLGVADADVDRGANIDNLGSFIGNSEFDFAIGAGTKATFLEAENISLGLLAQVSFTKIDDFDGTAGSQFGPLASFDTEFHLTELQVALGPTWKCAEGLYIYGGPFLHLIDGEAELSGTVGGSPSSGTLEIKEDARLGGYLGASIQLFNVPNTVCNIEFEGTGAGYAVAIQLAISF